MMGELNLHAHRTMGVFILGPHARLCVLGKSPLYGIIERGIIMINTTQLVVKTDKNIIEWLKSNGYKNPQNLPNDYTFSVFIVDLLRKEISSTNTICMAASCSCGNRPIVLGFEQLKAKLNIK